MNGAKLEAMICKWLFSGVERRRRGHGGRPRIESRYKLLHMLLMDVPAFNSIIDIRYNDISKYEEYVCIRCGFRIVFNGRSAKNHNSQ